MLELVLDQSSSLDSNLFVPPSKRTFGDKPDIAFKQLHVRLGAVPRGLNIKALYEKTGQQVPPELDLYMSYDLWLIVYPVQIIKRGGFAQLRQLGFEIELPEKPKTMVVDLFPQTQFVRKAGAELHAEAQVGLNGSLSVPDSVLVQPLPELAEYLPFGGQLTLSGSAGVVGNLSCSFVSPQIQAVGLGSRHSEWVIRKHDNPLVGDHVFAQVILTPRRVAKLTVIAKVHAVIPTFSLLPNRLESARVPLECDLSV